MCEFFMSQIKKIHIKVEVIKNPLSSNDCALVLKPEVTVRVHLVLLQIFIFPLHAGSACRQAQLQAISPRCISTESIGSLAAYH